MVATDTGSYCRSLPFPFLASAERGTASARPPEHVPAWQRRHRSLHTATAPAPTAAPGSPRRSLPARRPRRTSPRPTGPTASARGAARAPQRRGSRWAVGRASGGWARGGAVGRARGGWAQCRGAPASAASAPGPLALAQAVALLSLAEQVRPDLAAATALSPGAGRAPGSLRHGTYGATGGGGRYLSRAGHRGFL